MTISGQLELAAWEHELRSPTGRWYHGSDHQFSPGDLVDPEHSTAYYPDELGEPTSEQKVRRIMFTADRATAATYGSHVHEVVPTGIFHDHPYEKGTKVTGAPLRVIREAPNPITREQFREMYPPGLHDVPVEHLQALKTHGLYHSIEGLTEEIRRDGIRQPIDVAQEFTPWNHAHTASIADGVHRLAVAERLVHKTVPVHVWSEEEQAAQSARFRAAGYRGPATPWDALRQQSQEHSVSSQLGVIDLDWHSEARGAHGEWISNPTAAQWAAIDAARGSYDLPDHARLISERSPYHDPADHPFFLRNPVSPKNIADAWDAASDDDKAQGMRWYHDANIIAKSLSPDNTEKGAALLSAYSPQTSWPVNMLNAARAMNEGRAIGPGEGMITGQMQKTAQKIMDGASIDDALKSPKTNAFAHLILNGTDPPGEKLGKVVIDRHALSVAVGRRLSRDDINDSPVKDDRYYQHVADQYRLAAAAISKREGRTISPHQVQAVTWLHQQDLNQDADAAGSGAGSTALQKGRTTMTHKTWAAWQNYDWEHNVPVNPGTTSMPGSAIAPEIRSSPDGFSVSMASGKAPKSGYMVAMADHTHTYPASVMDSENGLADAIDKMIISEGSTFSGGNAYLGGWVHDGRLWLEPSENVQDHDQAVRLAGQRNQIAVWDVANGQEIQTGGSGGGRITEHDASGKPVRTYTEGDHGPDTGELPGPAGTGAQADIAAAGQADQVGTAVQLTGRTISSQMS
jgi:ParB-like nuclease domain